MTGDATQQREAFAAFDAVSVDTLRGRNAKWSYHDDDVLAAWVAEMDFPLAEPVASALREAVARGRTGYAPRDTGVAEACAGWLERHGRLRSTPDRVRIVPDILRGMELAITTFSRPESAVVVMTPSYPPFFETVRASRRPIVEIPLVSDGGRTTVDLDALEVALRAGAGTVLLCNPHNPIGRVFTHAELSALAAVVERHGARVIADEVHAPLVYPGVTYTCYAAISEAAAAHTITLTSASKGWNVAGLKCAAVVLTNGADLAQWDHLSYFQTRGASTLGMVANRAAFEHGDEWRSDVVAYLDGNRRLLARLLTDLLPQVRYTVPEGTYLAWLDCTALGLDDPCTHFLRAGRVALSDGAPFGELGRGHVRLNFATSRALLTEIVQRMARCVASHPTQS